MPVSVVIADDRLIVRDSLTAALQGAGFLVMGAVSGSRQAVALARSKNADLLVVNAASSLLDAVEIGHTMRRLAPGCRVVALDEDPCRVVQLLLAGVRGFLLWSQDKAAIIAGLRDVAAGNLHVCREAIAAFPPEPASA